MLHQHLVRGGDEDLRRGRGSSEEVLDHHLAGAVRAGLEMHHVPLGVLDEHLVADRDDGGHR
ncbi:hypothetical protein SDC9_132982 [bioreactor metagenome]|uniref:Uncharacterized protein n=1 Tax=bioreactor metagenome TaxID=1076179 RepID=A0A645D9P4_9ZZZZ